MTDAVCGFAKLIRAAWTRRLSYAVRTKRRLLVTRALDPSAHPTLLSHAKVTRSSSATASLIRRIAPIMHRRLALGRCSATDADSSRPGRASGPSLCWPGGAPGVPLAPFAGLLPHTGGGSFLIGPGPPACSSSRRAPIDFRRVESPLVAVGRNMRADIARRTTCAWIGFWASTPVCGPYPQASRPPAATIEPAGSFLPWAYSLSGIRAHGVHSHGLDPARIIRSRTRFETPSFRSWAHIRVFAATFFEVATTRTSLQRLSA